MDRLSRIARRAVGLISGLRPGAGSLGGLLALNRREDFYEPHGAGLMLMHAWYDQRDRGLEFNRNAPAAPEADWS